jgi:hypothetical protein
MLHAVFPPRHVWWAMLGSFGRASLAGATILTFRFLLHAETCNLVRVVTVLRKYLALRAKNEFVEV